LGLQFRYAKDTQLLKDKLHIISHRQL
jgi:hypothetical protein